MARPKRTHLEIAGAREATALAATLGGSLRTARRQKGWRQTDLAAKVGMSQAQVSKAELGRGGCLPFASWMALALAVDRPLRAELSRPIDAARSTTDAGHLDAQEFILELGGSHGWMANFELATRSQDPSRSIDLLLRDDLHRRLLIIEIWNRIGGLGAGARSSDRKRAEAEALAVAIGGDEGQYQVHLAWLLRSTAANRNIVRAYPSIFLHAPSPKRPTI